MMDIESEDSNNDEIDMEPLTLKTDKKLELSREAEINASRIHNKRNRHAQLNRSIDPHNQALRTLYTLKTKEFGHFEHFLTKNKHSGEKIEVLEVVRELAQSMNHNLVGRVSDKLQRSKMILRVISKEKDGLVYVQDETGRQKMIVQHGTVWVGMIALMEVTWSDGIFKLETVFDLGTKKEEVSVNIRSPFSAYRMLLLKGALMKNDSRDNIGLKVLTDELRILKDKQRTRVNCVVIMGPLLNSNNEVITNFLERTFDEEASELIKLIKDEILKILDDVEIVLMPSTEDLVNYYPIPQPKYHHYQEFFQKNLHFTSNPGIINLSAGTSTIKMNLLNVDLLSYIDEHRTGKPIKDIMQDNLESYFKQPFYLTNTQEEPFDQTNLPALYNHGQFGDIVVTSSRRSPPFACEVKGKVFLNIGCLGVDEQNITDKHYMTLVSVYDGSGSISQRTKVEILTM